MAEAGPEMEELESRMDETIALLDSGEFDGDWLGKLIFLFLLAAPIFPYVFSPSRTCRAFEGNVLSSVCAASSASAPRFAKPTRLFAFLTFRRRWEGFGSRVVKSNGPLCGESRSFSLNRRGGFYTCLT